MPYSVYTYRITVNSSASYWRDEVQHYTRRLQEEMDPEQQDVLREALRTAWQNFANARLREWEAKADPP